MFTLKREPLDAYDSNAMPAHLGSVTMGCLPSAGAPRYNECAERGSDKPSSSEN